MLARLLMAGGEVVPADRILEDLWGPVAAPQALGSLQSNVSLLRRVLEPGRVPRAPAEVLVSAPPGYALRIGPDDLDARLFENEVRGAERDGDLMVLDRALSRWGGPAYVEVGSAAWAQPEIVRLEELRSHARELRGGLLLTAGRTGEAIGDLEVLVAAAPLREEAWRLLALALYLAGRQGEALAALRRARRVLAEELGIDPGPRLREAEAAILAQDPTLDPQLPLPVEQPVAVRVVPARSLVGRENELGRLRNAAKAAVAGGSVRTALIVGEPGIGKSSLAESLAGELRGAGWLTVWGRCPETEGSPALWPWIQVLSELAAHTPLTEAESAVFRLDEEAGTPDTALTSPAARFRMYRALAGYLGRVAETRPLLVVLDDLHRADDGTLGAFRELFRITGPVLLAGTFRPEEATEELAGVCEAVARHDGARLDLAPLDGAEVATLVRTTCEAEGVTGPVEAWVTDAIRDRTGGNPFYVRETARLLASEGALVAAREVPVGAADVIRRRLSRLPATTQNVLRTLSACGREAPVALLVEAERHDADAVYDAVEAAVIAGLLTEPATGHVRFAHALIRDTVYADLPRLRRARLHAGIALASEALNLADLAALAHHFTEAASLGHEDKAVRYSVAAARQAERRFAYRSALALWERALDLVTEPKARVGLLTGRARAEQLAGLTPEARRTRAEAVELAVRHGADVAELGAAITAIDTPMLWSNRVHGTVDTGYIALIKRVLDDLSQDRTALRSRLLATYALESGLWSEAENAAAAAGEAVEIARELGDPAVLAVALNALYYSSMTTDGMPSAAAAGEELVALGRDHDMPDVQALGLLAGCVDLGARGEMDAIAVRVESVREIGRTYELPHLSLMAAFAEAARESVQGDLDRAEAMFRQIDESAPGLIHVTATASVARICARHEQGRIELAAPLVEQINLLFPELMAPLLACLRAAEGRTAEAAGILRNSPEPPDDFMWLLLQGFRADAAIAAEARDVAEAVHARLLPYDDLVCGGSTNSTQIGPVALKLASLAEFLGRDGAGHRRRALEVARRARSTRWEAEAGG